MRILDIIERISSIEIVKGNLKEQFVENMIVTYSFRVIYYCLFSIALRSHPRASKVARFIFRLQIILFLYIESVIKIKLVFFLLKAFLFLAA